MDETSRAALDFLRSNDKLVWVLDQLLASFSEGIAHSAKERGIAHQVDFLAAEATLTQKERTKREKYETSRPYDENEKLELIRFALAQVFVTLPAMQTATSKALRDLGSSATAIEFSTPDDEERPDGSYAQTLAPDSSVVDDLRQRLDHFLKNLAK